MEQSSRHFELSQQLVAWWTTQTDFKTKRALADHLEIHPDTLGDYLSGRKFPRPDIAGRLGHITRLSCLDSYVGATPFPGAGVQMPAGTPMLPPAGSVFMSGDQPDNEHRFMDRPEASKRQPSQEFTKKAERQGREAVVISLQRTKCPFCNHSIEGFRDCVHCGQHFVWANVPIGQDDSVKAQ